MRSFKFIAIAVVGVVLLTIGAVLPAGAEVVVSAKGGLHSFENSHYRFSEASFNYGFAIQYLPPLENRALDVGVEIMSGKNRQFVQNISASAIPTPGTRQLTWSGILLTAHYRPPVSTSIQPYVGGGFGLYRFTRL